MMEGLDESAVEPPPAEIPAPPHLPGGHPHSPPLVSSVRLQASVDFLLPATFLTITVVGFLFVLFILVIWMRSFLFPSNHVKSSKEAHYLPSLDDDVQHFRVIIDNSEDQMDEFHFRLPSDMKYIDEDVGGNVSPLLVNMKQSGGSSPKCPEESPKDGKKDNAESVPPNVSKSKPDTKFVFPPSDDGASTSKEKTPKFKVALPDQQWILHRKPPLDFRGYSINIPKIFGLPEVLKPDSDPDSKAGESSRKFSATRSPSLEKDDKSPLVLSQKDLTSVFGFGCDVSKTKISHQTEPQDFGKRSGNSSPIVEVRVQPLLTDIYCSPSDKLDSHSSSSQISQYSEMKHEKEKEKTVIGRRFGTCNNGLRINTSNVSLNQSVSTEKLEMQSSPRTFDSIVDKENNPSPRFSYSPKFFATPDSKSPKFFGTPDQKSPKFFATPDSKSPAFFADAQSRSSSPRTSDRNSSPRLTSTSSYKSVQSPLIISNASGECFKFDRSQLLPSSEWASLEEVDSVFINRRDSSVEQVEVQMQRDQDVMLNNVMKGSDATLTSESDDVNSVPSDVQLDDGFVELGKRNKQCGITNDNKSPTDSTYDSLTIPSSACGSTANYRRQRLKSISLDSDNAKFIEHNLGVPIVKHLKQENLYNPQEDGGNVEISSPKLLGKSNFFRFDEDVEAMKTNNNESEVPIITDVTVDDADSMRTSPDIVSPKFLRENSSALAFSEMQPRFSPKEFDEFDMEINKMSKNFRNLTIDVNKRDEELVKELREYDQIDSGEKRLTPKTPTLKIKATSLDSSETLNLSLPQSNTLQVPQNSISVPNTPKRHLKRTLSQKSGKLVKAGLYNIGNYGTNLCEASPRICSEAQQRKVKVINVKCPSSYMDSGIFLRENHANLMLFQASRYPMSRGFSTNTNTANFNRRMGSFDENMVDFTENADQIPLQKEFTENRLSLPLNKPCDSSLLGSNLTTFKQNLSVSSTNLKTLPEGVPSNDFDTHASEDNKSSKKTLLQRRGSNQSLTINLDAGSTSLKYSTLSLQGSNLSLASFGASSHNLTNIKNSASNFSLNTDNRQKRNIFERRNSNTSLTLSLDYTSQHSKLHTASNFNHHNLNDNQQGGNKCLLQRRGSNTSLTLNLQSPANTNLSRCTSNSSLNTQNDAKVARKKGLLERRSSNTSLTLNICGVSGQIDTNRVLSVSNYNLDNSGCTLSHCNSSQSVNNPGSGEQKKGLLERRNSNTSLTLNLNNYLIQTSGNESMRYIEIDDADLQNNYCKNTDNAQSAHQKEKHRKSLSTENLFPKSYKSRYRNPENVGSFGSHDNLCSFSYPAEVCPETSYGNNLMYVCGDQENEMIYAFGDRQHIEQAGMEGAVPTRNITTKPLSPHSTSEDFKTYLANIQHLHSASNILTRHQLKDLNSVFQDGYTKSQCPLEKKSPSDLLTSQISHLMLNKPEAGELNPQRVLPELDGSNLEYQKSLLRNLHQEFWDLPTNFQEKPMVFGSHPKNRYKTILPNEHSRVILRPEAGETEEGYINANYIKGHEFTKNCYIATQGPLQNTMYDFWLMVYQNSCQFHKDGCTKTNEDRHFGSPQAKSKKTEDAENSPDSPNGIQKIVMLTNLIENGRQKCEKYFPAELNEEIVVTSPKTADYTSACGVSTFFADSESATCENKGQETSDLVNSFRIKNVGMVKKAGYTIRKLSVEYENKHLSSASNVVEPEGSLNQEAYCSKNFEIIVNEPDQVQSELGKKKDVHTTHSLIVYHYWFDNWADHKCPKDVTALLDLSMDVMHNQIVYFEEGFANVMGEKKTNLRPRSEFVASRAKSFDKGDQYSQSYKSGMDKSLTNSDFTYYSKEKLSDSNKTSHLDLDTDSAPRERRLSAFQLAKAFFDEASKASNVDNADSRNKPRKNSLASRLDLPKTKLDLQVRRESTGKIDSKYQCNKDMCSESDKNKTGHELNVNSTPCDVKQEVKEMPPIIVHCSAGIGRTGCLIAIINGIKQLKADQRVDILGIVCNMRLNRGGMVQNSEQYELIHKVLCLYEHLGIPVY